MFIGVPDPYERVVYSSVFVVDSHVELYRVQVKKHAPRFDFTYADDFLSMSPGESRIIRTLNVSEWANPYAFDSLLQSCFFSNFCLECNTFCLWGEGAWTPSCGWLLRKADINMCETLAETECCLECRSIFLDNLDQLQGQNDSEVLVEPDSTILTP